MILISCMGNQREIGVQFALLQCLFFARVIQTGLDIRTFFQKYNFLISYINIRTFFVI